jgi:cytochrome P450
MTVSSELEKQVYSVFNLHDDAFQVDPYPIYEQLSLKPICKVRPETMWVVRRDADVKKILSNPAAFSSRALDLLYDSDWLIG